MAWEGAQGGSMKYRYRPWERNAFSSVFSVHTSIIALLISHQGTALASYLEAPPSQFVGDYFGVWDVTK